MKRNGRKASLAGKIANGMGAVALGIAVLLTAGSRPVLAANHKKPDQTEQCSLAVVTNRPVGSGKICDPKTVRELARNGHVFEQNQLGIVTMLGIGPGYDPQQALVVRTGGA